MNNNKGDNDVVTYTYDKTHNRYINDCNLHYWKEYIEKDFQADDNFKSLKSMNKIDIRGIANSLSKEFDSSILTIENGYLYLKTLIKYRLLQQQFDLLQRKENKLKRIARLVKDFIKENENDNI